MFLCLFGPFAPDLPIGNLLKNRKCSYLELFTFSTYWRKMVTVGKLSADHPLECITSLLYRQYWVLASDNNASLFLDIFNNYIQTKCELKQFFSRWPMICLFSFFQVVSISKWHVEDNRLDICTAKTISKFRLKT